MRKDLWRDVFGRWLALAFRFYLGGVFVYASVYKIGYAAEFAETVASYQIVPALAVNAVALVLPWLELICGAMLVAGVRVRTVSAILGALLVVFCIAVTVNLLRETPIDCGCFHTLDERMTWMTLVRDLTWLGMSIHVFFFDSPLALERRYQSTLKEIET
ncbi:MAG: MauE/DoxX family redox-associated membrane protein [Humidesulfovibrio sp.]|uniref:MauE/DoxX family redox-associated membrane protein n=1 Tax=Humidesulfovibrio sp. TaxID=2910988 RepID=UPI0027EFED74|nr:MauE/DoxX family redox-associated membrane protein [Humidesulfovibrio sp.]MDQ7835722.1 MauE/DoxX family redox-associated membrane protein [Humidesulfovibrio sp.]